MEEIRCGACGRKLGEGIFARLAIKCPRCGTLKTPQGASREFC
ncbi:MAG: Com family DNA-binding transcriptional regulator [Comamonadaceae bacterium]|nr:Com family DNA-binding transcriptional regulator [Comamonadaceae bacterium]